MYSEALGYHNQSIDGQNWEMVKSMAHPTFRAFLASQNAGIDLVMRGKLEEGGHPIREHTLASPLQVTLSSQQRNVWSPTRELCSQEIT